MGKATSALLLVLLIASSLPWVASAGPAYKPHENPETARSAFYAPSLLSSYSTVMWLISNRDFSDAESLLEQLKQAAIPDELKNAVDLYNSLTSEVKKMLENIEKLLQEADSLIKQRLLNDARAMLDQAKDLLEAAESKLGDLTRATVTIGDHLGVFGDAAADELKEAYATLNGMLSRVGQLRNTYDQLRQDLNQKAVEKQQQLTATSIAFVLTPGEAWVGDNLNLSGKLTDEDGNPLPQKTIVFYIGEASWTSTATDANGDYSEGLTVPYLYSSPRTMKAEYIPQGEDKNIYQASSASQALVVLFHQSRIELTDVPQEMYPGLASTISGRVMSTGGVTGRTVRAFLGGVAAGEDLLDGEGKFQVEATPPADIALGDHTLGVVVEPKEKSAGASQDIEMKVTTLVPEVVVHTPRVIVSSTSLRVDGSVSYAETPISGATVNLSFGGISGTTTTGADGTFSFDLSVPWTPTVGGRQSIGVAVIPTEPWLGTVQARASVFVLSPFNIALLSVAIITIGVVLYWRRRHPDVLSAEEETPPEAVEEQLLVGGEPKDAKERVLATYYQAVRLVQERTGVLLKPQQTLREYFNETRAELSQLGKNFIELTSLAEKALYSPSIPRDEDVVRAEQIAQSLRKELGG